MTDRGIKPENTEFYWWELFARIEIFIRCPGGPIAWQWAPETRQRYWGSQLVTPPSPERKREYHEGALARRVRW